MKSEINVYYVSLNSLLQLDWDPCILWQDYYQQSCTDMLWMQITSLVLYCNEIRCIIILYGNTNRISDAPTGFVPTWAKVLCFGVPRLPLVRKGKVPTQNKNPQRHTVGTRCCRTLDDSLRFSALASSYLKATLKSQLGGSNCRVPRWV